MQVLIPISARSSFFPEEDYFFPKPLIEVAGRPMIELVITQLKKQLKDPNFVFVIDREDARAFSIDRTVELAAGPGTRVIERMGETSGALCSCLLAIDALDPEAPLLISNSDQITSADLGAHIARFEKSGVDAGVVTFDSIHPRWSYVVETGDNRVAQTFEKKVVSRRAIAGLYYFRKAGQFLDAAQKTILSDVNVDGAFFISSAINQTILDGGDVMFSTIDGRQYHSFYAPSRITEFERSDLAASLRAGPKAAQSVNVIIPAAGEGSRFAKAGWKKPKPFIDVEGRPMLDHVIDNVAPAGASVSLLLRAAHMDAQPAIVHGFEKAGVDILPVDKLTEGTACTVLLARKVYDNDRPMMVANSDQLVDFDVTDYVQDCLDRGLDGSILVFRDPSMDPKWSFAKLDDQGLVTEVAEKKPISDLATVGIYLFTRGRDFVSATADMIAANERVNGEFYTCPVYNYMIANGARIGVYEVAMDAMSGLGTPEDLTALLKARGSAPSQDMPD
ncbi:glycosyltransferase family 2 protein [Tropicibacter oceani]|uniref:Glycosyltransferase family 2 protein n=1 Tax=Tropicibacter oceani TaxID=3058420 RepID=A0ABY8QN95_9RHOB|nr:glycosyltransferase family 2 protein [Tropicibacter oceani]WGW06067.1 glycosyltransferase family 2 protein [Tropicibacter oceani]